MEKWGTNTRRFSLLFDTDLNIKTNRVCETSCWWISLAIDNGTWSDKVFINIYSLPWLLVQDLTRTVHWCRWRIMGWLKNRRRSKTVWWDAKNMIDYITRWMKNTFDWHVSLVLVGVHPQQLLLRTNLAPDVVLWPFKCRQRFEY